MPQIVNLVLQTAILRQFLRFCCVGVIGFVADAGSLHLLIKWLSELGIGIYSGRFLSYLIAASVTWVLNRRYTFQAKVNKANGKEWTVYVAANAIGAAINYGCYAITVSSLEVAQDMPAIGVAVGSVAGLGFNFIANRYFVFR